MSRFSIYHDLIIKAEISQVFKGISAPELLNEWWTDTCKGELALGGEFELGFTQSCIWHGRVTKLTTNKKFELLIVNSHEDWDDTKVGFVLDEKNNATKICFYHSDWKNLNEHFRISSYCWAVYLRILKGYLEKGIRVAFKERDEV